jgi:histidyl-tRNA synthetase
MREANKLGAKYAIIIGDNELQQNRAQLKDLTSGNQETIDMDSIVSHITSLSF